ncbi:CTP synthase [Verrucomicrobiota bacterium]|jgi:CTP synthase|nr:CTP synthase [Verrucomicrobiota bacterium]
MKYIFVTGGVVSSLGKGIAAASLGTLLERRGLKVTLQKLDPYLNVDPGTMNPFEHGEVYVLDDGAETDLDLGHYERFTHSALTRASNSTSGQIYETVLAKERAGEFLGKTVQVVPHITDEIKARINKLAVSHPCDVLITEIGGTVGDIEGLPFLEAIRQFQFEVGEENCMIMHVTLVPYIKAAGELKTKPSQQSVAKLREIGLHPDVLIARTEHDLTDELRQKLSTFCNVPLKAVIEGRDVPHSIYQVPLFLQKEKLDDIVCERLGLNVPPANMTEWERFVKRLLNPKKRVRIAMVGKYVDHKDAYKSIDESINHAAASLDCGAEVVEVDAEVLETEDAAKHLANYAGILVPGGFGERGIEGKIAAAAYARKHGVPYLGLCLGMQIATIEFARNALGLAGANSTEFDAKSPHPVIDLLPDQKKVKGKGATMRLGTWPMHLKPGTRGHQLYGANEIRERHRHRYEFNQSYRERMEAAGFIISGTSPDGKLVELIELRDHPWFLACQYHPEFKSKPTAPHPLFKGFLAACLAHDQ